MPARTASNKPGHVLFAFSIAESAETQISVSKLPKRDKLCLRLSGQRSDQDLAWHIAPLHSLACSPEIGRIGVEASSDSQQTSAPVFQAVSSEAISVERVSKWPVRISQDRIGHVPPSRRREDVDLFRPRARAGAPLVHACHFGARHAPVHGNETGGRLGIVEHGREAFPPAVPGWTIPT
jgi:hypothetical protein